MSATAPSIDRTDTERLQAPVELEGQQHHQCRCNATTRWCVARTRPQAERWAAANLSRSGYQCYLPMLAVMRPDPVVRSMTHQAQVPLFPGYLFVAHQPGTSWRPIYETPGVKCLVKSGSHLQYARAGSVEALQADEAGRRYPTTRETLHRPGAGCVLVLGPFQGHGAVVVSVERQTAVVALMVLGGLRNVVVPVTHLAVREG